MDPPFPHHFCTYMPITESATATSQVIDKCVLETNIPTKLDIYATVKLVDGQTWEDMAIYMPHMNSLASTL